MIFEKRNQHGKVFAATVECAEERVKNEKREKALIIVMLIKEFTFYLSLARVFNSLEALLTYVKSVELRN